jgi:hypothetical protein
MGSLEYGRIAGRVCPCPDAVFTCFIVASKA